MKDIVKIASQEIHKIEGVIGTVELKNKVKVIMSCEELLDALNSISNQY